jgi:predicted Ser/Thr protein kinase
MASGVTTIGMRPDTTLAGDTDARAPEFAHGQIVGDCFRIEEVLGAGGMGVVYKARHLVLDRVVALKVHRGHVDRGRLEAEARAMARLDHPNVVGVYDVRPSADGLFIAMEYIDGAHARAWLTARKRPLKERLQMCLLAAEGLAAAHAVGLVHRDFKPENVLVSRTGRVAVADFGLAIAPGDPGEVVGTPAYMAAEQFAGSNVDARTDQFALCVFMHEALYGVRPFAARTPAQLVFEVASGRFVAPPVSSDVPAELRDVILRGLDPDPARRHPSIGALLTEVRGVMQAPAKRAVGLAIGIAVAIFLAVGVTAYLAYDRLTQSRARAVASPQLHGLDLGEDASEELLAQQHAVVREAQRHVRKADALEAVAEGDMFGDPEGFGDALAQAVDDEASPSELMGGMLDAVDSAKAARADDPYQRAAWDGKSTLVCGMNQRMEIRGVTARVTKGPAVDAQMGCAIRLIDCDIEAEIVVAGTMADVIYIEGGRYVAGEKLVDTDMNTDVTIVRVELETATRGSAVVVGMRGTARIEGSTLRGATGLETGMHAQVTVENSTIVGRDRAIAAQMHAKVTLRDTTVEGAIERGTQAIVEIAD